MMIPPISRSLRLSRRELGYPSSPDFNIRELLCEAEPDLLLSTRNDKRRNNRRTTGAGGGVVECLALDKTEARYLVAGDCAGNLSVFDTCRDSQKHPIASSPSGSATRVSSVLWYPHDQGMIISGHTDGSLLIWDSNQMSPVHRVKFQSQSTNANNPIGSLSMPSHPSSAPSSPLIAVCDGTSNVKLVNLSTGSAIGHLRAHADIASSACWSELDPYFLITAGADGAAYAWDVRNFGKPRKKLTFPQRFRGDLGMGPICGAGFSTDWLTFVTVHSTNTVSVFSGLDLEHNFSFSGGILLAENLRIPGRAVISPILIRDLLVLPCRSKIAIFDLASGKLRPPSLLRVLSGHLKHVTDVVLKRDNVNLYTSGVDGAIVRWRRQWCVSGTDEDGISV